MIKPPWQARSEAFHPYAVLDVTELPEGLRAAVSAALAPGLPVNSVFGIPADYRWSGLLGLRRTSEQAVIFHPNGVTIIPAGAKENAASPAAYILHDHILYTRTSLLLLQGRLEIGAAIDGKCVRPAVEFNTVGWPLLEDHLGDFIRRTAGTREFAGQEANPRPEHKRVDLNSFPYKFAAGLRHYGLLPGGVLRGAVFQPATWRERWGVLRDQVSPNTLLAFTDEFVILIEEQRAAYRRSREYGWIITHIPRVAVEDVVINAEGERNELVLQLARSDAVTERRLTVEPPTIQLWREIWEGTALS